MANPLGQHGENLAAEYLQRNGYQIVERNYRTRYGEVDIICSQKGDLVFVEVKTRRSTRFGSPEEAITYRKKEHIKKAALSYLKQADNSYRSIRFDVITIMIQPSPVINHIQGAF